MKALITVKEIAEVAGDFKISNNAIAPTYLDYDLNEWDNYAVEEAIQAKENGLINEVVTVTIGPKRAEETIRMALAKGADRAIRIWDDTLDEANLLSVDTKTTILSAVIEDEDPNLILSGVQSGDEANGATGVALAKKAGFEWAAVVNKLDLDVNEGVAHVHRELEGGVEEVTDVEMPAVLTIQTGINEPRYASLLGIRQAQQKPLNVQTLDDLSIDETALDFPLARTAMYEPATEAEATIWEGDAEETAGKLANFLREKGVVEA
jgi:electron transfer flavoprotein beta subunit